MGDETSDASNWIARLAPVILALAAIAVYFNSFAGVFVFDDLAWIQRNPTIQRLWPIKGVLFPPKLDPSFPSGGRPVVSLTLAINYAIGGTNPWGYHAVNLAIHILAAWTLFSIVRDTLLLPCLRTRYGSAATYLALIVALIWTVHPLQTAAVTYVIQRSESLAGLFYLRTLHCVIRSASSKRAISWHVAAVTSCFLGAATKEILVTAPFVVLLYDRIFLSGSFRKALEERWELYVGLAATWGVTAWLLVAYANGNDTAGFAVKSFTSWTYLLTQSAVLTHYLRLVFWPVGLCIDYGWPPATTLGEVAPQMILIVGLFCLSLWALFKRPYLGFVGAWFFVILAPTSSFMPIADAAVDHRMYLPLASVVILCVLGGYELWKKIGDGIGNVEGGTSPAGWSIPLAIVAMALVGLSFLTIRRNHTYHSDIALWKDVTASNPRSRRAHYNLAVRLATQNMLDQAIDEFKKTLEIDPQYNEARVNLGIALVQDNQIDAAIEQYEKVIEIDPNELFAHNNLGTAWLKKEELEKAIGEFEKAAKIEPNYPNAHFNLGLVLVKQGKNDVAFVEFKKALALSQKQGNGPLTAASQAQIKLLESPKNAPQ